jgi:hypothetical protein
MPFRWLAPPVIIDIYLFNLDPKSMTNHTNLSPMTFGFNDLYSAINHD